MNVAPRNTALWNSAVCVLVVARLLSTAGSCPATPLVSDSASQILVNNGTALMVVDKANGGLKSLKLGSLELLGGGGSVYFDANVAPLGTSSSSQYWRIGRSNPASYSFTLGSDYVDVAITHAPTSMMPMQVTQHFVMRDGEQGFHVYSHFTHTSAMDPISLVQTRMVMRGDPALFDHHSVTDSRFGVMPTPAELAAGTTVQDATTRLNPGTAYEAEFGKDVYTKYDWALDNESREVIGFYGDVVGAWIVDPNLEDQAGGPAKQHLTVHQTESTPVLLGMLTSTHYGTPRQIDFGGDRERLFGPFYVHLNTGPDHAAMRDDAKSYSDVNVHSAFYDALNIAGRAAAEDRVLARGRLLADRTAAAGAALVLSDNQRDFQFADGGQQYWGRTRADGTFDISGVSPGTYRLTAYVPGLFGEFIVDDLSIGPGNAIDLGDLQWQVPDHGVDLWQIGTFDRTAEEFRHGNNDGYRRWGLWQDYPADFPQGVNFVIGASNEANDWNFAHWESAGDWTIQFTADEIPAERTATLTIAVAGQRDSDLRVFVNGTHVDAWSLPHDGSILHRSGIYGAYQSRVIEFSAGLLIDGVNVITLAHIDPNLSASNTRGILYDAIRLEIESLSADFDRDGDVDGDDFLAWQQSFGMTMGAAAADGDADGDGDVDGDDFLAWQQQFTVGSGNGSSRVSGTAIPEPRMLHAMLVWAAWLLLTPMDRSPIALRPADSSGPPRPPL